MHILKVLESFMMKSFTEAQTKIGFFILLLIFHMEMKIDFLNGLLLCLLFFFILFYLTN